VTAEAQLVYSSSAARRGRTCYAAFGGYRRPRPQGSRPLSTGLSQRAAHGLCVYWRYQPLSAVRLNGTVQLRPAEGCGQTTESSAMLAQAASTV